jgi:hypothetical protein
MSVSVSAMQLRILVAAIVAVTVGRVLAVSIGDGLAASPASIAEPLVGAPAQRQSAQPPARLSNSAQVLRAADSGTTLAEGRDPDDVLATMAILADTYDETRMLPIWPGAPASPGSFATAGLVTLFGACSCVAISIYGLVAFMARRRPTELR